METSSKRLPISDPGYSVELRKALNYSIVDLLDEFTAAGWDEWETLKALTKIVCDHALAYQADRDQPATPRTRKSNPGQPPLTQGTGTRRQGHAVR